MDRAQKLMVALLALFLVPLEAAAVAVVNYRIQLTVDEIGASPELLNQVCGAGPTVIFPSITYCKIEQGNVVPVEVGDVIEGRFQIKQEMSELADGLHDVEVFSFSVVTGMLRWDSSTAGTWPSCFGMGWEVVDCWSGTRGITGGFAESLTTMGFSVVSGEISSLFTEIYSDSDLPNLTFGYPYLGGADRWSAHGRGEIGGTFLVQRIPEPSTIGLFGLVVGIAGLGVGRRRTPSPTVQAPTTPRTEQHSTR